METAALILQGQDDYTASEPVAGTLPLRRIVRTFKYAGIKRVVLAGSDEIMDYAIKHVTRLETEFIRPTNLKRKKSGYRQNAIAYMKGKCDRLLLAPAHYPLFDISTVRAMAGSNAELAAPVYNGERGYPVLLSSAFFDELIGTEGDIEKLFDGNAWEKLEVDDEGTTADVTAPVDAGRIAAGLALRQDVRPGFKLTLMREEPFYGPGIQELIRLVEETGSLAKAYALMGMASSYAVRIVKEAEAGLGFKLFDNKGGIRNGSTVTQKAREFAEKYKAFHDDCASQIEQAYKRHLDL